GQFERFCATIGIDDSVRPRGNVVFRASGDDNVLFDSGLIGGSDEPQDIRLAVQGVSELTLMVDYGEQMDLADHADWAAARVIRAAK
ncbi:MAG: NPCBM/NEW2 domain-containing protein, partial [Planctomycetota bacterium]